VPRVAPPAARRDARSDTTRSIFDAGRRETLEAWELRRADMATGDSIDGPAVITEDETTTIITAAFRATMQADGALLIERRGTAE
jgi:N-methylhydantoinase A